MFASTLLEGIGFGLVAAAVIALGAVGLSLQLSVTNYINFAFGDLMSLGAYFVITFNLGLHMNFYLAALLGAVALGIVFVIMNIFVLRPFVRSGARVFTLLVVTIGVSFIVQNGTLLIWGLSVYRQRRRRHAHRPLCFDARRFDHHRDRVCAPPGPATVLAVHQTR
jgi:branched-subunit amino acid ABC-type transport system permease component